MRTCSTISSSVLGRPDQHSSAAAIAGDLAFFLLLNLHLLEELAAAEGLLEMESLLLLKARFYTAEGTEPRSCWMNLSLWKIGLSDQNKMRILFFCWVNLLVFICRTLKEGIVYKM